MLQQPPGKQRVTTKIVSPYWSTADAGSFDTSKMSRWFMSFSAASKEYVKASVTAVRRRFKNRSLTRRRKSCRA
jgi:hypothetical protein